MQAEADQLPHRMHEPLLKGRLSHSRLTREEVASIVRAYYLEQGWRAENGFPLAGTMQALDIANYASCAESMSLPPGPVELPPVVLGEAPESVAHQE
jgi:hypothetical protein